MDLVENSVKAGARNVEVEFGFEPAGTMLRVRICDDGPGFPAHILEAPTDPYRTTRTQRTVGLGLGLFEQSATDSGGTIEIRNRDEGGAWVQAYLDMAHIDARPLGDLEDACLCTALGWPDCDLTVRVVGSGESGHRNQHANDSHSDSDTDSVVLDTRVLRTELDGIPLDHPAVRAELQTMLAHGFSPLRDWVAAAGDRAAAAAPQPSTNVPRATPTT